MSKQIEHLRFEIKRLESLEQSYGQKLKDASQAQERYEQELCDLLSPVKVGDIVSRVGGETEIKYQVSRFDYIDFHEQDGNLTVSAMVYGKKLKKDGEPSAKDVYISMNLESLRVVGKAE